MSIQDQLFVGERIRLTAPDPSRDAEVESRWTHDPDYLHLIESDPVRPLTAEQIRRKYEAVERDGQKQFLLAIRLKTDDRLLGFVAVEDITWNHGSAQLRLSLGEVADRRQGYGSEALRLALRWVFGEMNLHRIGVRVFEYNEGALRFFTKHGFVMEVRQRQALNRLGRRWDLIWLGLLDREWELRR
jgi:RimJ/RimL family protein N-acetyltransferase